MCTVAERGGDRQALLTGLTGAPVLAGNTVDILYDGDALPAMIEAVEDADRAVDMMTYVWWGGEVAERFAEALAGRAEAGVRVRVLVDSIGSKMDAHAERRMREAGVVLEFFRPYATWKLWQVNMRTHRRVLVCDDEVAFTGGVGVGQEWMGVGGRPPWRETHLRVRGPAVDGIHAGFYADWLETPHPPIDEHDVWPQRRPIGSVDLQVLLGSSQPGWNSMALALQALIGTAGRRLRITSAYFRPPRHFRQLLCETAQRGVEVQILLPGPHADPAISRAAAQYHYEELLEHGVQIHEYQPSMVHAKVMTIDGEVAMLGTTNFDARSLTLNEQIAVILHDADLTADLDRRFEEDVAQSRRIELDEWRRRSRRQRGRERFAHAVTFPLRGAAATERGRVIGSPPSG
jgi:cardiolipin synthase A/B